MSKFCIICNQELSKKALKPTCKSCRHKEACRKWAELHKNEYIIYQQVYRQNNREMCNERTKNSRQKNLEYYRERNRINYKKAHGIPLDRPIFKRKNGEGTIDQSGYKTICVKGHPNQLSETGKIREHTYVMSMHIGRPLLKEESVHHKNGDRLDNRIENLELWSKGQPPGQRVEDKLKWCKEFLELYGYTVIMKE